MSSAKILLATEIKKGDIVYQFGDWNFFFNQERRDHYHRDEKGRCIYTARTVDEAYVKKHVVYSAGKKRMYLTAEDGKSRGEEFWIHSDGTFGNFTSTPEQAVEILEKMFSEDVFSKLPHKILFQ